MANPKLTSYDLGYQSGDLSIFPLAIDSFVNLYEAANSAETKTTQTVVFTSDTIVVEDTSAFPEQGVIRMVLPNYTGLSYELIYYYKKTTNSFQELLRGFCNTKQSPWPIGTLVQGSVIAEHHNAIKDAILQIENKVGIETETSTSTIQGLVTAQESRFYSPRPQFKAYPTKAYLGTPIRFQNFSNSITTRYFWDFGDGNTSLQKNPVHTYRTEGKYTVELRIITELGGQGILTKQNYITISNDYIEPFFYATPTVGRSRQYATANSTTPTTFTFVDQTKAEIVSRIWQFDDGTNLSVDDPDIHTATHIYQKPKEGGYKPSLIITLASGQVYRTVIYDSITVI